VVGGTFTGDAPVLFTGATLGLKVINEQGSGNGNDHAFDDIRLLDVTPQLDKSFSPTTAQVGGTSTLTFSITNTADLLAKSGWSFTDTLPAGLTLASPSAASTTCAGTVTAPDGGSAVSVADGRLAAGQVSCTVTVNVTSATAGTYTNDARDITATTGLNPPGGSTVTFTDTPAIGLVKSVSPTWFSAAGQTLSYGFLVTNPSKVPLTGITVTDTDLPGLSAITCPLPTLNPGGSETCTATYVTTAADLLARSVTNTATATGTPPTGPAVTSDPSQASVPAVVPPSILLVKSATPRLFSAAGQLITFHYVVTNTSQVTLFAIAVNDTLAGLTAVSCPLPVLYPGDIDECTATYRTTAADVDAGSITNLATAQGDPPDSTTPVVSNPATVTVPAVQQPAISILKSAQPATFGTAGQAITYSYLVTNSGNVTLSKISVNDGLPGLSGIDCPSDTLPVGIPEICTATYTTTAADLAAGQVTNTARATGTPPSGPPVTSDPSNATITAATAPAITIEKSASPVAFAAAGQAITYSYLVTNAGNVQLTGITVNDDLPGLSAIICPDSTLPVGQPETCTAIYTTTAADLAAGKVTNTATATGTPPSGPPVDSGPSTAVVPAAQAPAITIVKSPTPEAFAAAGQTITYSYLVTNAGNVPLTGITVNDNLPGLSAVNCPDTTLGIGQPETCTATYVTTAADVAAGSIINTATAAGFPPGTTDVPVISGPSTAIVPTADAPAITVLKSAQPSTFSKAGQTITYSYLVTNAGNVPLTGITVNDNLPGLSAVNCPESTLPVGPPETCTATYVTTAADLDAGLIANTATAQGLPPSSTTPVTSDPSAAVVTAVEQPGVRVVKSATPATYSQAGQVIHYTFRVTNTGNVTLTHVHVNDKLKGLSAIACPEATLTAGQSETCTATYRVTAADLNAGHVTNSATAAGDPPHRMPPDVSPPSTATETAVQRPGVMVAKTVTPASFAETGQVIRYSFRVTNTGDVTLTHVHVTDKLDGLSAIACPEASLAAGQSETCTASYLITAADLAAGHVTNSATAHGDPPAPGTPVASPPSTVTIKGLPTIPVTG
jgi:uncharacterized repeat protein (TIGR01451 family)